jgi:serine/threonine-protein kinase RsbW
MSQRRAIRGPSHRSSRQGASGQGGPNVQLELSLRSEVNAITPFVQTLLRLIRKFRWAPGSEDDNEIEIALREAVVNAVVHGNHEDPGKQVCVSCRCGADEISIVIRDEGEGFDIAGVPDPTTPENVGSSHGRGIYLMKALMDEVRFEQGGTAVYMRKFAGRKGVRL